ncbi:hypothetical protein AVEN_145212-1 [Araneus ventricosus]|uniref:Uncharacterized protein n=1 Tax=Araneus ventricosus TaxID=182803 RepID=A0A4Y2SL99_ARAVE|nr:hypothetical protein AVEN_145212-1 [Araneus ventricosus]
MPPTERIGLWPVMAIRTPASTLELSQRLSSRYTGRLRARSGIFRYELTTLISRMGNNEFVDEKPPDKLRFLALAPIALLSHILDNGIAIEGKNWDRSELDLVRDKIIVIDSCIEKETIDVGRRNIR